MSRPLQPVEAYPAVAVDVLAPLPAALGPAEDKLSVASDVVSQGGRFQTC